VWGLVSSRVATGFNGTLFFSYLWKNSRIHYLYMRLPVFRSTFNFSYIWNLYWFNLVLMVFLFLIKNQICLFLLSIYGLERTESYNEFKKNNLLYISAYFFFLLEIRSVFLFYQSMNWKRPNPRITLEELPHCMHQNW